MRFSTRLALLPLLALPAFLLAACSPGRSSAAEEPAGRSVIAVQADAEMAAAIRQGDFFRWALPRLEGVTVEVGPTVEEPAVVVDRLPAGEATRRMLQGLPVEVGAELRVGEERYSASGHALAVRVPDGGRWVVVGGDEEKTAELVNEVLFRMAGRRGRGPRDLGVDFVLRESAWLERSGRWIEQGGKWTIGEDHDDIGARDRAFAGLVTIPGRGVTVMAAPAVAARPEIRALAAALDGAAIEMARRVPVVIAAPITVAIEPDYLQQARHTGEVGEAVLGGGRAEVSLVYQPADLHAYRFALAERLIARAGVAAPVGLAKGAALWLSGDWYGRSWQGWLPALAAARALPTVEQLLAVQAQGDTSGLLSTPPAAFVMERLAGATIKEKLARVPTAAVLGQLIGDIGKLPTAYPARRTSRWPAPFPPFFKGVSLAMMNSLEGGYHAPGIDRQLDVMAELGANSVSLMPFAFQAAPDSPELRYLHNRPEGETDIGLIHAARRARARGLRVLYKPHIWVGHDSWTGEIAMKNEADWAAWWASYRRYVLHHAVLAAWSGSEVFSVGVELSKTVDRPEWRELIDAVRQIYPGAVTYSGNWYGDLEGVKFWDRLDYVGVDAYYPLAASASAGREELARGAREIVRRLAAAAARSGRPVMLTEVGFAARRGAWVAPHEEGGEASEADQAAAYEALLGALGRPRWLAGTFVWKAFSGEGREGRNEADFRFLGRPAEGVVRKYYGSR